MGYGMGRHAGKLGMVASLSTFLPKDSCRLLQIEREPAWGNDRAGR